MKYIYSLNQFWVISRSDFVAHLTCRKRKCPHGSQKLRKWKAKSGTDAISVAMEEERSLRVYLNIVPALKGNKCQWSPWIKSGPWSDKPMNRQLSEAEVDGNSGWHLEIWLWEPSLSILFKIITCRNMYSVFLLYLSSETLRRFRWTNRCDSWPQQAQILLCGWLFENNFRARDSMLYLLWKWFEF